MIKAIQWVLTKCFPGYLSIGC